MFKLPADVFKGKIVIDSNNYFPGRDGQIADIDNGAASSAVLQKQVFSFLKIHLYKYL